MIVDRITLIIENNGTVYQFAIPDFAYGNQLFKFFDNASGSSTKLSHKADVVTQIIKNKYGKITK